MNDKQRETIKLTCFECAVHSEMYIDRWRLYLQRHKSDKFLCRSCRSRKNNIGRIKILDHKTVRNWYDSERLSVRQIANRLNLSYSACYKHLNRLGIARRSTADASSNSNNQRKVEFSLEQLQLILGSMLGDAALNRHNYISPYTGLDRSTLKLTFNHSQKQLAYLQHKRCVLPGSKICNRLSGFGAVMYHYTFSQTPSLEPIAAICHDNYGHKRVSRQWLGLLDWRGVAWWYQDDGSLLIQKPKRWPRYRRPIVRFHTNSFSREEIELLQEVLETKFGLRTRTEISNNDSNQLGLASRHQHEAEAFLTFVSPFIVPCLRHKVRWVDDAQAVH